MAEQPQPARQTSDQLAKEKAELGANMATDPEDPKEHYFLASDKKTKVNAWGEEKGSDADKKRMAGL